MKLRSQFLLVVLGRVNLNTRRSVNPPSARTSTSAKPKGRTRITTRLRADVVEYYSGGNVSALQAAEQFGLGKSTVLKILKEADVSVRKHGQRLS
jgi:hypothetical protein